jgi:CRISPR-associated protein Cmr3
LLHLPAGMGRSKFEPSGQWISQADMAKYLQGNAAGIQPVGSDALFERETRYGIQQEAGKRVVKEGMLFQVEYIRPCEGVGLHVELDAGLDGWKPSGRMRIGGEGHGARFEAKPLDAPLPELKPLGRQFKLILTTPAYFEGGWQPADWNAHFTGGKVVLQAAALGRYLSIGGYDWATNDHKPARRYVPAGSVYYFRADADVSLKNNWLCDAPGGVPIGQIGYGQVVVAQW